MLECLYLCVYYSCKVHWTIGILRTLNKYYYYYYYYYVFYIWNGFVTIIKITKLCIQAKKCLGGLFFSSPARWMFNYMISCIHSYNPTKKEVYIRHVWTEQTLIFYSLSFLRCACLCKLMSCYETTWLFYTIVWILCIIVCNLFKCMWIPLFRYCKSVFMTVEISILLEAFISHGSKTESIFSILKTISRAIIKWGLQEPSAYNYQLSSTNGRPLHNYTVFSKLFLHTSWII